MVRTTVACRLCGSPKLSPSRLRIHNHVCARCHNARPASKRSRARWMNRKAIRAGGLYLGHGDTPEQAQQIRAHIRRRLDELKSRQSARAKTEGVSIGAVSTEA